MNRYPGPGLTVALAAAFQARAAGGAEAFLDNPTPLRFVIKSQGPCTPGPVVLTWTDPESGLAYSKGCQHPFEHDIDPQGGVHAALPDPGPGERAMFKFNLEASTGTVRFVLLQQGPKGDGETAGPAKLCVIKESPMFRRVGPTMVTLTREHDCAEERKEAGPEPEPGGPAAGLPHPSGLGLEAGKQEGVATWDLRGISDLRGWRFENKSSQPLRLLFDKKHLPFIRIWRH